MRRTAIANNNSVTGINQNQRKILNPYHLTGNQKMVHDTLLKLGRSAGAYELLDILRKKGVNAAATVYRALNELSGKGLVKRINSTRTFIAHKQPKTTNEKSLMLICKHCGEVSSIDDEKLINMFDKNISQSGYRVNSYHLELIVTCDRCAN